MTNDLKLALLVEAVVVIGIFLIWIEIVGRLV